MACKRYPAREIDGLIFVFPGDPALAEARVPKTLGLSQRKDYKTRRLNREVACHYTFMHENLFDMNHQFMHRKNMGSIKARCIGREHGDDWAQVEYTFSRTGGKPSMGEKVIVDLVRKRGEAKKDFSDHMRIRTDYPTQSLRVWVGRDIKDTRRSGARRLAELHAARRRAEDQPHVRLPVGEEAADPRPDPRGLAVRDLVHRADLRGGQGDRRVRAARLRRAGRRLEQRGLPRRSATCAACSRAADGRSATEGGDRTTSAVAASTAFICAFSRLRASASARARPAARARGTAARPA